MTDRPNRVNADGQIVPLTDEEFAQWQADNAAAEAAATEAEQQAAQAIPTEAGNYAMRKTLIAMGKFDVVDQTVSQSGDQVAQMAWAYADPFEITDPIIGSLAPIAGFTEDDIGDAFRMSNNMPPLQTKWDDAWNALNQAQSEHAQQKAKRQRSIDLHRGRGKKHSTASKGHKRGA